MFFIKRRVFFFFYFIFFIKEKNNWNVGSLTYFSIKKKMYSCFEEGCSETSKWIKQFENYQKSDHIL